jgi:hypothetical protein
MCEDEQSRLGVAQVRICECAGGFVVSIGPVSVRLDRTGAQDVVAALSYALLVTVPADERSSANDVDDDNDERN